MAETNNAERYVAAIEICSSKIIAAVGKPREDGRLDIIATDQERCVEGVRYGIIQNLEETSMRVARILERIERKPSVTPRVIDGVFVGLSGRSLRSICTEVKINLPDETEVNEEVLKRLHDQALSTAVDSSLEVVDAIPRLYHVGKQETLQPRGMVGNSISATYDLIVCRPELRRMLTRTLTDKLGVQIEGFIVTALSTAQVILKPDEKRLGCMLVDIGAETTAVTIYKGGHLEYFVTLPLGGRNITRDLTSLGHLLEEKAEELKITSGNAQPRDMASTLNINGVQMNDVSNLIVARAEEIALNIVQQIYYAGLKEKDLPGGIICIGGGSKLNGMLDLLKQLTNMSVRRGEIPQYIAVEDSKGPSAELIEVASVLYSGAMTTDVNCLEFPTQEEMPINGSTPNTPEAPGQKGGGTEKLHKPKGKGLFGKFSDRVARFFSDPGEDKSDLIE